MRSVRPMATGQIEEVCSLDEGMAVIQFPEAISKISAKDLEDWLSLVIRKVKRRAQIDEKDGED